MGMQGDEHNKNTELAKFPHLRSIDTDESRWWKSTDDGIGLVTNEPGVPIEVTLSGDDLSMVAVATTPDPVAGQGETFSDDVSTPVDVVPPGSQGNLYLMEGTNPDDAANCWVEFYDSPAASVVLGTTPPLWSFGCPLGGGSSSTSGHRSEVLNPPMGFTTGLSVAVLTAPRGNTAVGSPVPVQARVRYT